MAFTIFISAPVDGAADMLAVTP